MIGHPDFHRYRGKAGEALSARELNALREEVRRQGRWWTPMSIGGFEGLLTRPQRTRAVKLVWGRIIQRDPVGAPPPPPTGPAGSFRYIAQTFDGAYTTQLQRPIFQPYNDIPEVIAAPTKDEDFKNSLCVIALDAPDSDNNPSVQLFACRERLNFELCPQGGTDLIGVLMGLRRDVDRLLESAAAAGPDSEAAGDGELPELAVALAPIAAAVSSTDFATASELAATAALLTDLERRFRILLRTYSLFVNEPPPGLEDEFAISLEVE